MFEPFDFGHLLEVFLKLMLSYVLTLPIGWEREKNERSLGLRTFPLVSLASTTYVLIGIELFSGDAESQSRLIAGLMTGIGFIGGGAILKKEQNVRGTATAASLWATGALGTSVAYGRLGIAFLLSLVIYATLRLLTPIKEQMDKKPDTET